MSQVEVEASQGEVFDYVTDPTHFPEWQANVIDVDEAAGAGTSAHRSADYQAVC